ncbi:hypothetical protein CVT24_002069 [Panaeolus cyanescens]|uniref:Uncharacterized protein n=1 Tax=Panaeolus cyanescens TaxID=181874 RepID=A0A409W1L9_9AGAR|nr:hypothetical protein CVT24_002069 [Panaeolus cyanescens]
MSALPSFVELMASLGLEQTNPCPEQSPSPPPPSSPGSPALPNKGSPARSSSSPALRDVATRHRLTRFSPYSPAVSFTKRRGSLSSVSSSDFETSPLSATFSIPPRPEASRRRYRNKLTVNTYGSSCDLTANTPISTYVRRKTPGTSPTSPTFSRDSGYESSSPTTAMPFSIPSLPVLLPSSAGSETFPIIVSTSESDIAKESSPLADITEGSNYYRYIRRRTGVRISTSPSASKLSHFTRREPVQVDMA